MTTTPTEAPEDQSEDAAGPCTAECVVTHADTCAKHPRKWVGALVRLKGNPIEGHDRIGTVRRVDGDWAVVDGQFTRGLPQAFPVAALERIQITVLP